MEKFLLNKLVCHSKHSEPCNLNTTLGPQRHLSEGESCHTECWKGKNAAFTLAEAIIVIAIIGVVAVITLPTLISDFSNKIYDAREKNISNKVSQAVLTMKAMSDLGTIYESTDDFVDELEKHLKIIKRCDVSHLTECWPSTKVINALNKTVNVSTYKVGTHLQVSTSTSNLVGLVLGDGAPIILAYTPRAIDVTDDINKALSVVDFVMDVNGAAGPNSEKTGDDVYDIRSFRNASFGKCTEKYNGKCVMVAGTADQTSASNFCNSLNMDVPSLETALSICENTELMQISGIDAYWTSNSYVGGYFAAVTKTCDIQQKLRKNLYNIGMLCIEK